MNKIPTAEEWIEQNYPNHHVDRAAAKVFMVELHVEAALKAAAERAKWDSESTEISFGYA